MISRRPDAAHDDRGFTLAELVISIMILGFIVSAIGVTMSVGLHTASSAADRISSSRSAHALAAFFPSDVEALSPAGGADTSVGATTSCPGSDPGANVLTISPPRGQAVVSYRLIGDAAPMRLVRVACDGGSQTRTANIVVDGLNGPSDVVVGPAELTAASATTRLTMTVTTHEGDASSTFTVSGTPRASITTDSTCTIDSVVPARLTINGYGHLAADMPLVIVTNNVCNALSTTLITAGDNARTTVVLTPKAQRGTTWTGTLSTALAWTAGTKTMAFSTGETRQLSVVQPCALISAITPASASIDGFGRLTTDITLAFTVAGSCGSMAVKITTGGTPPTLTVPVSASGTQWTSAPIHPADATWSLGAHIATVLSDGVSAGGATLTATPQPCTLVTAPQGPTTVLIDGTSRLTTNAVFTFATSGVCSALAFAGSTGGAPASLSVVPTGGPAAWTLTLRPADATWTAAPANFTLSNAGETLATAAFTVAPQPCAAATGSSMFAPSSVRIDASGNLIALVPVTVRTTGVCGPMSIAVVTGDQATATPFALALGGGPTTWTGQLHPLDAQWTPGTKMVTISNAGAALATANLSVTVACTLVSATPPDVQLNAAKQLVAPTQVTVTTSGTCGAPSLSFATGPGPGTSNQNVQLTAAGQNTWVGNLSTNATWTTGTKTVTLTDAGYNGGTFALNAVMAPPCVFVDLLPGKLTLSASGVIQASSPSPVVVTTTGLCGPSMTVRFNAPGAPPFQQTSVPLTLTVPGQATSTWTANLVGTQWQKGRSVTFSVYNSSVLVGSKVVTS